MEISYGLAKNTVPANINIIINHLHLLLGAGDKVEGINSQQLSSIEKALSEIEDDRSNDLGCSTVASQGNCPAISVRKTIAWFSFSTCTCNFRILMIMMCSFTYTANVEFVSKNEKEVKDVLATCIEENPTSCNKDTGAKQRMQKWSRGHLFIVRAGGIIDRWNPLYK